MPRTHWIHFLIATLCGSGAALALEEAGAPPPLEIIVSVAEQKLALLRDGGLVRKYPISTSKFGLGDSMNSYRTPLGSLHVWQKIGGNLALGAVIKGRNPTGEILAVNAPGRDPIVTRILWLDGDEGRNANAKSRGIYIHGTVEESRLGQPVSYGCIRMRSRDVVEVFEETPVGTPVRIIAEKFPRFRKAVAQPEILLVSRGAAKKAIDPRSMVLAKNANEPAPKAPLQSPAAQKSVAKAPEPPAESGPVIVFTTQSAPTPAPAEPRVVFTAMLKESIVTAPLPHDAAGTGSKASDAATSKVASTRESSAGPRWLALHVDTTFNFLGSDEARPQPPLDLLSTHLLNPPETQPPMRLAFRTAAAPADL